MNIEKTIKERPGTIIDVRTPEEFASGNVAGSMNIPLHEIPQHMEELKNMTSPLFLCCASGNRSTQAFRFLTQHGIKCYNGGSWHELNNHQAQTNNK